MNRMLLVVTCLLWSLASVAAEPAPQDTGTDPKPAAEATSAEPSPAPPPEDLSTTAGPRVRTSPSAEQPKDAPPQTGNSQAGNNKPAGPVSPDRLQLDTTIVTGNRELPKVLYIVPWKKADIGELPAQPFNSLLDEALQPVDRDVFRREVTYYGVITGATAAPASEAAAKQQ